MREIKLRGYSVEKLCADSQWVEGFGVLVSELAEGGKQYILFTPYGNYEVHGESVGQNTGLEDGNPVEGLEIYENDILYDPVTNETYIVTWDESYANFFMKNISEDPYKDDYDFITYDVEVCNSFYVLGNAFEHPELLEGKA